ncbi:MAG: hypothetical protein E6J46_04155 [Chloroflexi bacterium]|nr:MAG: hypothetical protein E6J46_04155 [Chloroflexota bacterium]
MRSGPQRPRSTACPISAPQPKPRARRSPAPSTMRPRTRPRWPRRRESSSRWRRHASMGGCARATSRATSSSSPVRRSCCRRGWTKIGPTNALAEAECRELEERYQNLAEQLEDITEARADLEDLISKLRQEEESRYEAVFGAVAANFHEYFSELNPGGRATLRHAEGEDGPRSGVEILVQPPRKRLQNVTLLSSGERSLAALALVLALDEVNPSPFTILDEVDAALDDANVDRFGQMVARLGTKRQFLVITHNHVTMSYASTLYGIHLDESGSSHLVSVRLDDIRKPATRAATTAQAG